MSILKFIFTRQFIVIFIVFYVIYYYEQPRSIFNNILERHGLDKLLVFLKNKYYNMADTVKDMINTKLNDVTNNPRNPKEKAHSIEADDSKLITASSNPPGENEDMFCNKKKQNTPILVNEDINLACLLSAKNKSTNIYKAVNAIPYNYSNNLENNVLYNISPTYTKEKQSHEIKLLDKVAAKNERLINTNFNKDLDLYKINKRVDCFQNIKKEDPNYKPCFAITPQIIKKEIKLFTRVLNDKINLNWNIPILPTGFYPDKIVLEISKSENKKADMFSFKYNEEPCKIENDLFSIKTIKFDNRIMYTLSSDNEQWWSEKDKCFTIFSKVYFFFKYYDNNRDLRDCFIESNKSSFYKN
jgi:hypothetical protein